MKIMPNKKKEEISLAVIDEIEEKIFVIRGRKIMLDSDLQRFMVLRLNA